MRYIPVHAMSMLAIWVLPPSRVARASLAWGLSVSSEERWRFVHSQRGSCTNVSITLTSVSLCSRSTCSSAQNQLKDFTASSLWVVKGTLPQHSWGEAQQHHTCLCMPDLHMGCAWTYLQHCSLGTLSLPANHVLTLLQKQRLSGIDAAGRKEVSGLTWRVTSQDFL